MRQYTVQLTGSLRPDAGGCRVERTTARVRYGPLKATETCESEGVGASLGDSVPSGNRNLFQY